MLKKKPVLVPTLTKKEIKALDWNRGENYALVNTQTKRFFLTSDTKQKCKDALVRMTDRHPLYYKLQLVKNPNLKAKDFAIVDELTA